MKVTKQIADRFREVLLSGTWIANTNFKAQLTDLNWKLATTKVGSLNTIASLTFHIHYYIKGVLNVLGGGPLNISDKYSFNFAPVASQEDWETRLNSLWNDAEKFAALVEKMPEGRLNEIFAERKYGTYQRNIEAMIEHSYYHLGQIVLIRKLLLAGDDQDRI